MVEKPDSIIVSIKLRSGKFEGSIEVPLYATKQEREDFIDQWLHMMEIGLKVGEANRGEKK